MCCCFVFGFFLLDQTEASGQLLNINELSIDDTLMMYETTNCIDESIRHFSVCVCMDK